VITTAARGSVGSWFPEVSRSGTVMFVESAAVTGKVEKKALFFLCYLYVVVLNKFAFIELYRFNVLFKVLVFQSYSDYLSSL